MSSADFDETNARIASELDPLATFRRYCEGGFYDQALLEAERLIEEFPAFADAHAARAIAVGKLGRQDEATALMRAALAIDPECLFALFGFFELSMADGKTAAAEHFAKELLRLAPEVAISHRAMARVHFARDEFEQAVASADRALALDPIDEKTLALRSEALDRLGRSDESRLELEKALGLSPDDASLHERRAWQALWRDDFEEAAAGFQEALRLDPTSASARTGLASALRGRSPFYRWLFGGLRRFADLSKRNQVAFVIAIVGAFLLIPRIEPFLPRLPSVSSFYTPLAMMLVMAIPYLRQFANLQLFLDPVARPLVSRTAFAAALLTTGLLVLGLAGYVIAFFDPITIEFGTATLALANLQVGSIYLGDRMKRLSIGATIAMFVVQPMAFMSLARLGVPILSVDAFMYAYLAWRTTLSGLFLVVWAVIVFRDDRHDDDLGFA